MKTYLEPYFAYSKNDNWWPGLVLTSYSDEEKSVEIIVRRKDGTQASWLTKRVPPREIIVLVADDLLPKNETGRYSMYLTYGAGICHRLLQGCDTSATYTTAEEILPGKP